MQGSGALHAALLLLLLGALLLSTPQLHEHPDGQPLVPHDCTLCHHYATPALPYNVGVPPVRAYRPVAIHREPQPIRRVLARLLPAPRGPPA